MYFEFNDAPTHQRSRGTRTIPSNPTRPFGNYWEMLTRFYIGNSGGAEVDPPHVVWFDDIRLSYVPPTLPVTVVFDGHQDGDIVVGPTDLPFTVTNHGEYPISGWAWVQSVYNNSPDYHGLESFEKARGEFITLQPGESRSYPFRVNDGRSYATAGFTPEAAYNRGETYRNRSNSNPNVERRWNAELGVNYC